MAVEKLGAELVIENLGPFLGGMKRFNDSMGKGVTRARALAEGTRTIGVAMTAISAPITAFAAVSLRTFGNFEQSMARVRAITGATPEQFDRLTAAAEEMGRTTVFSAREAAGALQFMSQAGLDVETQMKALPQVLQLAAAAQIEIARAADIVTNVMAGFGLEVEELTRANDVMTIAFTSANTDLTQLSQAMKFAGPVARGTGQSFEETTAILARMGNAGIQATQAGTALRRGLINLLSPSGQAERTINELGLVVFDASGKMRSLVDLLDDMRAANITTAQATEIFGARAISAFLPFLEQGTSGIRDLTNEMLTLQGVTAEISAVQLDTMKGDLTLLTSASEGLQVTIGRALSPAVRELAQALQPVLVDIAAWIERHPKLTRIIAAGAVIITGLGIALIGLSVILPGIAIGVLALSAAGFTLSAAFLPVTLIVLGITAAIAGAILVWRNWDRILFKVRGTAIKVGDIIKTIIGLLLRLNPLLFGLDLLGIIDLPSLPSFGSGGIQQRSGMALVGERGPEVVHLPGGSQVTPTSRTITNNITANYTNPQEPQSIRLDMETLAMLGIGG